MDNETPGINLETKILADMAVDFKSSEKNVRINDDLNDSFIRWCSLVDDKEEMFRKYLLEKSVFVDDDLSLHAVLKFEGDDMSTDLAFIDDDIDCEVKTTFCNDNTVFETVFNRGYILSYE